MQDNSEERTVVRLLRRFVDANPEATAIECGKDVLTYRRLWDEAGAVAARLQRTAGFEPGGVLGVLFERGVPGVVAQLAAWRAGAAYLPLDPALPDGRIESVLKDARPFAALAQPDLRHRVPQTVPVSEAGSRDPAQEPRPLRSTLAYVIYTSGSTGTPKGVEVGHASLVNLLDWHRETYGTGPGVRVAAFAGLGFDASVWEVWATLAGGATLVLPAEPLGADVTAISDFLQENAIEQCFLSTPLAEELIGSDRPPGSLRVLLTGGDRLRVRPGGSFPAAVHNHYGPTEATVVTTASQDLRGAGRPDRPPVIGAPITGARVRLVDPQGLDVVGPGETGELLIGGEVLATGYRNDPALTEEKFVERRAGADGTADRWYASGDVCRWTDSGDLEFVERRDAQLSVRGNRVEPAEIEHTVLTVAEVSQSAVVLWDDGSGGSLAAFYCGAAAVEAVQEALVARLPRYMVPSRVQRLDAMPLTPNGKIDRDALLEIPAGPAQRPEGALRPGSTEEGIAEIWAELTGIAPDVRDNFFDVGGHSLLAARMIGKVRDRFGVKVGLQAVFDHPVLADLAAEVDAASKNGV
ncbi:amino acid adenylation domain-containing protein [Streptomyces sp. NPDC020951]|uniref:amino acid adenylation domain-containing protein n=1 Tax=Streptomyces sp. NPDC020951 TaxID=3365104 RepID=UPI003799E88E